MTCDRGQWFAPVRKRYTIPLLSFALLLLVIGATVVWAFKSGWMQRRAMGYLNRALAQTTSLHVDVRDISGNLFSEIIADSVVISTVDSTSDTLAIIPRLSIQYTLTDFWRGEWKIQSVFLDSPRVWWPPEPTRTRLQQNIQHDREKTGPGAAFNFNLAALIIRHGSFLHDHDSTALFDSIDVALSAVRADGRLTVHLDRLSTVVPRLGRTLASGIWKTEKGIWSADSVHITTSHSRILASGTPIKWKLETQPLDLSELGGLIGQDLHGTVLFTGDIAPPSDSGGWYGQGHINGDFEGFTFDNVGAQFSVMGSHITLDSISGDVSHATWRGAGWVDLGVKPERYAYHGNVQHFNLEQFAPGTFASDLSGHVRMTGQGLRNEDLALDLDIQLGPGQFDSVTFDSAAGLLRATSEDIVFAQDFRLQRGPTGMVGGGRISFSDSIDVFANVTCNDLRIWDPYVFVDSLAGRSDGYVYLSGLTRDPNLSGRITSDSLRMYDLTTHRFEASFFVPRFLTHPTGDVEARFGPSMAWAWGIDSVYVRARLAEHLVFFDSLSWSAPEAVIQGRGQLDWTADTIPITLYPVTAHWLDESLTATDTVKLVVDSTGFNFSDFSVKSAWGTLQLYGRVNYDESLDLVLDVEGVPVPTIGRRFFPQTALDGQLDCTGRLQGTLSEPKFDLDVHVLDLRFESGSLGDLSGTLSYSNRRLSSDQLVLESPDHRIFVTGVLPMELRFDSPKAQVLDEPLSGRLVATGASLDAVTRFLPETLESIRGPFSVSVALGGTPRTPRITGDAYLRGGVIKTVDIANPIQDVQIDVSLYQDTVEIKRASGIVREKRRTGEITASGKVRILAYNQFDYDVSLTGRHVPVRFEFEDFSVESDFDLTVEGPTPPTVRGRISPTRVEDREPFANETMETPLDTTLWNWDMTVELPGNYWIHNDQIDAELSSDLRLVRDRGRLTYLGTAEILRGKVYIFDKTGTIRRGSLTFDDPNTPDPTLDIDVTFRINQPRVETMPGTSNRDIIELGVHVAGRASQPLIQPEPPYTEQDFLLLLMANSTLAAGDTTAARDPWADRLKFAATGLLFSEVQRVVARKLRLETLEITSGSDPRLTEITVGRYVSPHLYLYGSSPLDVGAGQEVGFEYRFNRRLYLEGNRDKNNLYRLNLHLNWDY